ncbi:hypothetical protein B6A14_08470 [Polynucleobacter hirudinilacicola]|uniref:Uncharacterized protein n=1 Tax=Polynucleobacter hirudinilacicola TaxID=1743166 RepID=A0A210RXT8_9BURK|nr:hypothetical protein [Polynucleobacter hirudinilacicola]OWF65791.1 hypothetical protein B6A14_08470 [Polynucleobacter hirudinilacicola]
MSNLVQDYFEGRARQAIALAAKRVSDLRFFEQVHLRLKVDEDLTKEVPAFKQYDKKEAIAKVKELVARCHQDLKQGYWVVEEGISQKVKTEFRDAELVPRYFVEYKIATRNGKVTANVSTIGANIAVELEASGDRLNQEKAIEEAGKVLMWANIKK